MSTSDWTSVVQTSGAAWLGLCIAFALWLAANVDSGGFFGSVWDFYVKTVSKSVQWLGRVLRGGRR